MKTTAILSTLVGLLAAVSAHPGKDHSHEAEERAAQLDMMGKRSLSHCSAQLAARGVHARNVIRRRALLEQTLRRKRDLASVVAVDHKSNLTGITESTASSTLFTGTNQCLLAPDVTQGPYCEFLVSATG